MVEHRNDLHDKYLLFINRVCFSYSKILRQGPEVRTELASSVRKDLGFNILQYEKQTRLINSLLDGQRDEGRSTKLKKFL